MEFPEDDREENELMMIVQSVVGELVKAVLSGMDDMNQSAIHQTGAREDQENTGVVMRSTSDG